MKPSDKEKIKKDLPPQCWKCGKYIRPIMEGSVEICPLCKAFL